MEKRLCSESSTSSTTTSSSGISWNWGNILNSTNSESVTSEGSDGGLGTWTNGSGGMTTSASQLDVDGIDTDISKCLADIDGGKHSYRSNKVLKYDQKEKLGSRGLLQAIWDHLRTLGATMDAH